MIRQDRHRQNTLYSVRGVSFFYYFYFYFSGVFLTFHPTIALRVIFHLQATDAQSGFAAAL